MTDSKVDDQTLEPTKDGYRARLRYGKGLRGRFLSKTHDAATAKRRETALRATAEMLMRADQAAHAFEILTAAAGAANDRDFAAYLKVAEDLCKDSPQAKRSATAKTLTFEQLGTRWTSGELHRDHPDQIKHKRTADHDAEGSRPTSTQ